MAGLDFSALGGRLLEEPKQPTAPKGLDFEALGGKTFEQPAGLDFEALGGKTLAEKAVDVMGKAPTLPFSFDDLLPDLELPGDTLAGKAANLMQREPLVAPIERAGNRLDAAMQQKIEDKFTAPPQPGDLLQSPEARAAAGTALSTLLTLLPKTPSEAGAEFAGAALTPVIAARIAKTFPRFAEIVSKERNFQLPPQVQGRINYIFSEIKQKLGIPQERGMSIVDIEKAVQEGRLSQADAARYDQAIYDEMLKERGLSAGASAETAPPVVEPEITHMRAGAPLTPEEKTRLAELKALNKKGYLETAEQNADYLDLALRDKVHSAKSPESAEPTATPVALSPQSYQNFLRQKETGGILKLSDTNRTKLLDAVSHFPFGQSFQTKLGETVRLAPPEGISAEDYAHHLLVKRAGNKEHFSATHLALFDQVPETIANYDERILGEVNGKPRVYYVREIRAGGEKPDHVIVAATDQDGGLIGWTHFEARKDYRKSLLEKEKALVEERGLRNKEGQAVDLTHEDYRKENLRSLFYLGTRTDAKLRQQPGSPSSDTTNIPQPEKSVKGGKEISESFASPARQGRPSVDKAPAFYSGLQAKLMDKMPNAASTEQVRAIIKDAKQDEVNWSGIEQFLEGKQMVKKTDLLDFLKSNEIQVKEVVKGELAEFDNWSEKDIRDHYKTLFGSPPRPNDTLHSIKMAIRDAEGGDFETTKFHQYTLPGGENYRELLLTLPEKEPAGFKVFQKENGKWAVRFPDNFVLDEWNTREQAIASQRRQPSSSTFTSSHFDEPNVLAHVRFNERTDAEGKRVLFIEEIQSDWHQKGREVGYRGDKPKYDSLPEGYSVKSRKETERGADAGNITRYWIENAEGKRITADHYSRESATNDAINSLNDQVRGTTASPVPDAPFKKTWHELALKRMLRYAAENGFDKISWTTGEQQAERYDLSKQVDEIIVRRNPTGGYLAEVRKDGKMIFDRPAETDSDLANLVGKDLAKKAAEDLKTQSQKKYSGLDLKVGGEGMKGFYDQIIPSFLNKYAKKWGGRVGETFINRETGWAVERANGERIQFQREQDAKSRAASLDGAKVIEPAPGEKVHSLDIAPSMKRDVLEVGQPLHAPQHRTASPTQVRIPVAPITGVKPKKLDQIVLDVSRGIDRKIFFGKPAPRSGGTYYPGTAATVVKYTGDLDTTAHELAHALDDRFGLVARWAQPGMLSRFDRELAPFWVHGSTTKSGPKSNLSYKRAEGVAEFIRAWLVNPQEAEIAAPRFSTFMKTVLPPKTMEALKTFSNDIRAFAGATAHEQIMANVRWEPPTDSVVDFLRGKQKGPGFKLTWADRMQATLQDDLKAFTKAADYARGQKGIEQQLPANDPVVLARLYSGAHGKMDDIFEKGMIDTKNARATKGGIKYLFETLDTSSPKTLERETQEVASYMIAERTIEKTRKLNKYQVSGIGGGVKSDIEVARARLQELEQNPKKLARIKEAAARYREWSDAVLRYMKDKGRISEEAYEQIKANNEYYVAMRRIMEIAPGEEIVAQGRGGGKLGSAAQPIKQFRGSTRTIENPYTALMESTYRSVREADRNEVMLAFRDLLVGERGMGQGRVADLASIGRKASPQDKNTIPIFVNGKLEAWQFQEDVYKALKGIQEGNYILPGWLTILPRMMRTGITRFPAFALRNFIRDAQERAVISDVGSGLFSSLKKRGPMDVTNLKLYGGDQAGHYLRDQADYVRAMKSAMDELAKSKFNIIVPMQNLGRGYNRIIESAEMRGRMAEYSAAFRHAKNVLKLDDYNAGLYAASKARGILDFAVAGNLIRVINQMVPFTNAAIQGTVRAARAAKDRPGKFAARWMIYAVLPALFERTWNAVHNDKEYIQLPAYQRDMFFNFKINDEKWLVIPKGFLLGTLSSSVTRALDAGLGYDKAFEGYGESLKSALLPVDEQALGGPFQVGVQAIANYDFFRDRAIVPRYEEKLDLDLRNTAGASRFGQTLQRLIGTDARKIDFVMQSQFGYAGRLVTDLSDLGRDKDHGVRELLAKQSSLMRNYPAYAARDVQWVMKTAAERGLEQHEDIKDLKRKMGEYWDATPDKKDEATRALVNEGIRIRKKWEGSRLLENSKRKAKVDKKAKKSGR